MALSVVTVLVFTGLTAYDVQNSLFYYQAPESSHGKFVVISALNLFLTSLTSFLLCSVCLEIVAYCWRSLQKWLGFYHEWCWWSLVIRFARQKSKTNFEEYRVWKNHFLHGWETCKIFSGVPNCRWTCLHDWWKVSPVCSDLSLTGELEEKVFACPLSENLANQNTRTIRNSYPKFFGLCFKENGHAHGVCGR